MTLNEEYGLNAGLNKGIKLKKVLKKVSLKNTVKLVKKGIPIATSLIPFGSGMASNLVSKALNTGVGKFATKVASSKTGKTIGKGIKVVKTIKKNTANPAKKTSDVQFPLLRSQPDFSGYSEKYQPIAQPVATTSARMIETDQAENFEDVSQLPSTTEPSPIPTQTKNNTLLYVGGAAVLGAAIFRNQKK